jgi:hypothetical protein
METIYEKKEMDVTQEGHGLLKNATDSFMANLPIFVCGLGVIIALGWDALA